MDFNVMSVDCVSVQTCCHVLQHLKEHVLGLIN